MANHWQHAPGVIEQHGPNPCGLPTEGDDVCSCGCTAYEEACEGYLAWYEKRYAKGD